MHILTASRRRIELDPISLHFRLEKGQPVLCLESDVPAPDLTQAARAFFGLDRGPRTGRRSVPAPDQTPALFLERDTGVLRMFYREAVIRFRDGVPLRRRRSILRSLGVRVRSVNRYHPTQCVVYATTRRRGAELLEEISGWFDIDEIRFATPNFVSQYYRGAAPRIHREQWYLRNTGRYGGQKVGEDVDAREAWKVTRGSRRITVAVLDDGVDVDHPNLRRNVKRNPDPDEPRDRVGRDFFIPDDDDPEHYDPRPKVFRYPYSKLAGNDIHGTPCAGVIAAAGANRGAVGIAPGCRILAVKIFHADAFASDARVADAIRYSAAFADVLSCSWAGGSSPDVELAIEDAGLARDGRGAAVFCAAGNEYGSPVGFPASHPEAIAVGASTDRGTLASYSNVGPELWVVAPSSGGVAGIFTTDVSNAGRGFNPGDRDLGGRDGLHTNDFGGTSSATPLAAGVGALVLSVDRDLDRTALREILANSADRIGRGYDANGHSTRFGHGRVNAGNAVSGVR